MNRNELLDKIEEIQHSNLGQFEFLDNYDAIVRHEIADLVESEKKAECIAFMKYWFGDKPEDVFEDNYNYFKQATEK